MADGLKAEVSEPLEIMLWGDEDEIQKVTAADIHARVDVSSITEEGDYVLPVTVTASSESGVTVRGSYEVTVHVTRRDTTPETGQRPAT